MRASNNGVDIYGGGGRVIKINQAGVHGHDFWVKGVCLCGEGVRGVENAKKAVLQRWNSRCEGAEVSV